MSLKALAAVILVALATTVGLSTNANAGPFEDASAYLGNKYGVPDFQLKPVEFGANNIVRIVHLGLEIVVEKIAGGIVVYTPAKPGTPGSPLVKAVFVDAGKPYSVPDQTQATMALCGPGHWHINNIGGKSSCVPAGLTGNSGGSFMVSPEIPAVAGTPATPRSCTFEVNVPGSHEHSC